MNSMSSLCLRIVLAVFILQMSAKSGGAIHFTGEFTGSWTEGVPEVGINVGDCFNWFYTYETGNANGDADVSIMDGTLQVFRTNIKGITAMDSNPDAWLTIENGHVVHALMGYQFDDPRTSGMVGLFMIGLDRFDGFGEGVVRFWDPISAPEQASATVWLISLACMAVGQLLMKKTRTGTSAHS